MSPKPARSYTREFKEAAVRRIGAGEKVHALAKEPGMWPRVLCDWWDRVARGGVEALLPPGRPPTTLARRLPPRVPRPRRGVVASWATAAAEAEVAAAQARVAELERKVGQQALELYVFAHALRSRPVAVPPSTGPGASASTPSSGR